jgi:hypothetical protein
LLAAERNWRRHINDRVGDTCRVENANQKGQPFVEKRTFDKQKIVVKQMPENINGKQLRNLFPENEKHSRG